MNKQNTNFRHVLHNFAPQGKLIEVRPLTGGYSAEMVALEYADANRQLHKIVVRQHKTTKLQTIQNEFQLLQQLHQAGQPTPKPFHLDISCTILPNPYLIIEFMEGEMLLAPENLATHIIQLANQLAAIHQIENAQKHFAFLPTIRGSCIELTQQTGNGRNLIMQEEIIRQKLVAASPIKQINENVLLHGDFWPGNSLWQNGQLVAVIDWEDAYLGDPLRDLAISRLDIVWIFGIEAMHQFTQQYQAQMDLNYTNLPYWDLGAALRLIRIAGDNLENWVAFFPPFGRDDITVESLLGDYGYYVAQALSKLARG